MTSQKTVLDSLKAEGHQVMESNEAGNEAVTSAVTQTKEENQIAKAPTVEAEVDTTTSEFGAANPPNKEWRSTDEFLVYLAALTSSHAWNIRVALNITISEKDTPIAIAQKLLFKIRVNLEYLRREGSDGERMRVMHPNLPPNLLTRLKSVELALTVLDLHPNFPPVLKFHPTSALDLRHQRVAVRLTPNAKTLSRNTRQILRLLCFQTTWRSCA